VLADGPAVTRDDLPIEVLRPSPAPNGSRLPRRLRAGALSNGSASPRRALPASRSSGLSASPGAPSSGPAQAEPVDDWDAELSAYERQRLLDALGETRGNKSEAARLLGMPRTTLCSKLKKHGLG
jgi:DNA-binding NtrC family response regulator